MPVLPIHIYGKIYDLAAEKYDFHIRSLLGLQEFQGELGSYVDIVGVNKMGGSLVLVFTGAYVCLDIDGQFHSTISPALYLQPNKTVLDSNKWDRHYYLHGIKFSHRQWLINSKERKFIEFEKKVKKSMKSNPKGK